MQDANLKSFDKLMLYAVRYGLFFVFIIPFIVTLTYLYPWVSGKIWGFELMVEILFPLWVMLAFRRKEYRPAANAFLYAMLGYFAVATIAMIFGDMPHRSMWSKPDRLTGMFFQYHLLGFWLMASTVWREKKVWVWAATTSLVMATYAALWGFGQAYLGMSGGEGGRGSASLGNPDYLGQYLVPHVFVAAWLFWRNRENNLRWWYAFAGVVLVFGIFSTKSRGALLGLIVATGVGLLIAAFKAHGKGRKLARWGLVAMALLPVLFFAANKWRPTAAWLYDNRMAIQYFQETTGPRKLLYVNVLKGIKDRPVLGWGPENFESAFYYHYDPISLRYSDYETRQDRPHNLIFDILVNVGVIGFIAYALIFFFAWRLAMRSKGSKFEATMLVLATVGHIATNLFIFETPISYINLFVMLALLGVCIAPELEPGEDELSSAGLPMGIIVGGLILWIMSYAVLASMHGAAVTSDIIVGLSGGRLTPEVATELVHQLEAVKTPEQERYIRAVTSNFSSGRNEYVDGPMKPILAELAAIEYKAADQHQHDYVNGLVTATAVASLGPTRTPEQQAALEEAAARIQRLAPNRQEVYWLLGQLAFEKGDLKTAESYYQHALDLDSASLAAQGNFAAYLIRSGQFQRAMAFLKQYWPGMAKNLEAAQPVSRAVVSMLDKKQDDALLALYDQAVSQDALTFEWAVAGALAAIDKGDLGRAVKIIADTKAKFPDKVELIDQYVTPQLQAAQDKASGTKK